MTNIERNVLFSDPSGASVSRISLPDLSFLRLLTPLWKTLPLISPPLCREDRDNRRLSSTFSTRQLHGLGAN